MIIAYRGVFSFHPRAQPCGSRRSGVIATTLSPFLHDPQPMLTLVTLLAGSIHVKRTTCAVRLVAVLHKECNVRHRPIRHAARGSSSHGAGKQKQLVIAAHCIIIILSHAWSICRNKSCQLIKDDGFPKPSRLLSYPTYVQSAPYSTYRVQDSICSKRIPFPNLSHHAIAMWKAWPTYPCPPRTHLSIIPVSIKSNQALTRSSLDPRSSFSFVRSRYY